MTTTVSERVPAGPASGALLSVQDLRIRFATEDGPVYAVNGVSFDLAAGEILALVGESGCGKSVTAMSVPGLLAPSATIEGRILLEGRDVLGLSQKQLRSVRGKEISFVFQEPMSSLNPAFTVGKQIREVLQRHEGLSKKAAHARAVELLRLVRIPAPERRVDEYPHQLSGGMRQRVMIAIAVACGPKVLVADEPTTALDVTIQAGVLDILRGLRDEVAERGAAVVAHGLVERRDGARGRTRLAHVLDVQLRLLRDLLVGRHSLQLQHELALGARDLLLALDDVHGNANRA
jgi:peptide/nickel transport system ATP-binding protein